MPLTQLHESLDLRGPDAMAKNEVFTKSFLLFDTILPRKLKVGNRKII